MLVSLFHFQPIQALLQINLGTTDLQILRPAFPSLMGAHQPSTHIRHASVVMWLGMDIVFPMAMPQLSDEYGQLSHFNFSVLFSHHVPRFFGAWGLRPSGA